MQGPRSSLSAFLRCCFFIRDLGISFGCPVLSSLGCSCDRDSHSAECSRSSRPQAPSQVPPRSIPWRCPFGTQLRSARQLVLSRSRVNAQDGPWGKAKPSSSGLSWCSPSSGEALPAGMMWQHTPAALVPSPSSPFPHVAHSDTWDVS